MPPPPSGARDKLLNSSSEAGGVFKWWGAVAFGLGVSINLCHAAEQDLPFLRHQEGTSMPFCLSLIDTLSSLSQPLWPTSSMRHDYMSLQGLPCSHSVLCQIVHRPPRGWEQGRSFAKQVVGAEPVKTTLSTIKILEFPISTQIWHTFSPKLWGLWPKLWGLKPTQLNAKLHPSVRGFSDSLWEWFTFPITILLSSPILFT